MSELILSDRWTYAEIVPAEGARVQHLIDRSSSRELLYQRTPPSTPRREFMAGCPGGWDEMFPNDTPWKGHPDHGRIWSLPFQMVETGSDWARLRARLDGPSVTVERTFALLPPARRGLHVETELYGEEASGPFLWASHPMLAVQPEWTIDIGGAALIADEEAPGRFTPGEQIDAAPPVPEACQGWSEVLYATGLAEASVVSPDGRHRTRIAWDATFLRHLWVVTVTGAFEIDLCLLFEPCTSRPYRVEDAITAGQAASIRAGETRRWWTDLESLDLTAAG